MNYRTLAISALVLGLFAPVGAMADSDNSCSEEQKNRKVYADCKPLNEISSEQFGAAVVTDVTVGSGQTQKVNGLGSASD